MDSTNTPREADLAVISSKTEAETMAVERILQGLKIERKTTPEVTLAEVRNLRRRCKEARVNIVAAATAETADTAVEVDTETVVTETTEATETVVVTVTEVVIVAMVAVEAAQVARLAVRVEQHQAVLAVMAQIHLSLVQQSLMRVVEVVVQDKVMALVQAALAVVAGVVVIPQVLLVRQT